MASELEKELAELKKEYEEGELTLKGYRKRSFSKRMNLLQAELEEGDITEKGFSKKKAKLEKELDDCESPVDITQKLAAKGSTMQKAIKSLFGGSRSIREIKAAGKSKEKKKPSSQEKTQEKTSSSQDKTQEKTASSQKTACSKQLQQPKLAKAIIPPHRLTLINPKKSDSEVFLKELHDSSLYQQYRLESLSYIPRRDDETSQQDEIDDSISQSHTLLSQCSVAELWIASRKSKKMFIPKPHGHFYLVPETMMLEYDSFQSEVAAMTKPPGEVLLLPNQLLKKWTDEVNIPYKPVLFKGLQVLSFSREDMDYLCEWIDLKRNE